MSERHSWIACASAIAPSALMLLRPMHINHLNIRISSVVSEPHSWIAAASAFAPSGPRLLHPMHIYHLIIQI